jgi:hypothetical protein
MAASRKTSEFKAYSETYEKIGSFQPSEFRPGYLNEMFKYLSYF